VESSSTDSIIAQKSSYLGIEGFGSASMLSYLIILGDACIISDSTGVGGRSDPRDDPLDEALFFILPQLNGFLSLK
jgi:hypothetical protein